MSDSVTVTRTRTSINLFSLSRFRARPLPGTFIIPFFALFIGLFACLPVSSQDQITHIVSRGPFDASMRHFVQSRLLEAERTSTDLIVLELQSHSGRVDYVLDIAETLNRCDTSVSIYVSGPLEGPAIILALSGDELFMHSNAQIKLGSAASKSNRTSLFKNGYSGKLASRFASIAKRKGYPSDLARAMVNPSIELQWLPGNAKTFLTKNRMDQVGNKSEIDVQETVNRSGELMSLSPGDANRFGLTGDSVSGLNDVLSVQSPDDSLHLSIQTRSWPWTHTMARIFTGEVLWALLIILGTASALLEIRRPGIGWSGVLSVAAFGLPVFTYAFLGLVPPPVMILLLIGLCSFALDTLLIPGVSVLGFLGLLPTSCSLILAGNSFLLPDVEHSPWEVQYLFDSFSAGLISLSLGIAAYSLLIHFFSEQLFTLTLVRASTNPSDASDPAFHPDKIIGTKATVQTAIRPIGTIVLNDQCIRVVSQNFYLEPDTTIEIQNVDGRRLTVRVL